jgi:tellurite resistance protein TerC
MKYYTGFFIEKALSIDNIFVIGLIFTFVRHPGEIPVPRAALGHHRRDHAARHDDRGWALRWSSEFLLVALPVRGVPDRDRHQDALHDRPGARRREQSPPSAGSSKPHAGDPRNCTATSSSSSSAGERDRQAWRWRRRRCSSALVVINVAIWCSRWTRCRRSSPSPPTPSSSTPANIMAILGLRALYFALAAMVHRFHYLKFALAAVLVFIGSKIFVSDFLLGDAKFPPVAQPRRHLRPDRRRHRLVAVEDAGGGGGEVSREPSASGPVLDDPTLLDCGRRVSLAVPSAWAGPAYTRRI